MKLEQILRSSLNYIPLLSDKSNIPESPKNLVNGIKMRENETQAFGALQTIFIFTKI